ncbi:MAG TPA: hypothetical protein VM165_12505 [Planctomycetaceae bacterium]|nr:hypothetical protein [Planctomycetaceae bacterium]
MMRSLRTTAWAIVPVAALAMCGCGGGVDATTTVTYRPSRADEVATTDAAPGAAATTEVAAAGGVGSIKGRVLIQGSVSPLPPLYAKGAAPKDPSICGLEAAPNESIVVNDGGLANVFIYLPKPPKGYASSPVTEPAIFDQKYCVFKPHALVVRTGQPLSILNDDAALHNTHTYPSRNTGFNQGIQANDRTGVKLVYTKPEAKPLQVGCDVHNWMTAYHLPVDHPFATASGPDGSFEIKDLPAGKHDFKVWHEKGGELEKAFSVTIKAGETVEIDIPVAASKLAGFQGEPSKVIQLSSTR